MKGPELTPVHLCCWLLLSLTLPLGHGDSLTWIDLTDFDSIYREIGLKDQQSNSLTPESSDHCTLIVSNFSQPNDAFRVVCHTVQKCQISPFHQTDKRPVVSVVNGTTSVVDLWHGCTYADGGKLFRNDNDSLDHLESTVIQLMFGGNRLTAFPDQYFCGLTNLTRLDLSKNKLGDLTTLGLTTECAISHNDTNCCGCKLKELILEANEFDVVSSDSFCGLPNLVVLRMSRCRVREIDVHAFRGLNSLKYLDLSRNNLTQLFNGTFDANSQLRILFLSNNQLEKSSLSALKSLKNIRHLYLDRNQIEAVVNGVFSSFIHLRVLSLRENLLTRLEPGQFDQLSNLCELDLSFNQLSEIGESTLTGISDVTLLDLSENYLQNIETGAFGNCLNLTTLRLSSNRFNHLPNAINSLFRLKHLYMDRNEVTTLSATNLVNLTNLTDFDLSDNKLTNLERGIFDGMKNLVTLKLTGNKLTNVHRCFTSANVVNLFLDNNRLTNFTFDDFSSNTKYLSIFGNEITTLGSFDSTNISISEFKKQELNLGCNQIKNLSGLLLPSFVSKFNVRSNRIQSITYNTNFVKALDNSNVKLDNVQLQNNYFEEICQSNVITSKSSTKVENYFDGNPLMCSCEMAWLLKDDDPKYAGIKDVSNLMCTPTFSRPGISAAPVKIKGLSQDRFLCKSDFRTKDRRCKCDHSKNCSVICPERCNCYSTHDFATVYIDCGHSGLQTVPQSVDYSKISKSTIVYLDGNNIHRLNESDFASYTNVIKLYLNRSNIAFIDVDTFELLVNLQVLHLEDNELQTLPVGIFETQTKLTKLYLQDNLIDTLSNDVFLPLQSLQIVDISHNLLTNYSVWELDKLGKLQDVDLKDNRWSCNCEFLRNFSDFTRNSSVGKLADGEHLYCTESNNSAAGQAIDDYYYSNCYASQHTFVTNAVSTITYIWASLLGIFVCVTIIALILFYFRQEMQVLFYSHYGVRIFNRSRSKTAEEDGKIYDAFIAYSSEDEEFLVYKLLPGLENIDRPYRLCLHQRDFAPGAFITDSILEAVERSSRTIILLSENFIKSEWCKFEFKTAHVQMLHDRCARVLVVVVGDIPTGVDPEMKLYLKTNTYLKWGEKLFWEKLYFALPEKRDEPKEPVELLPRNGSV